MTDNSLEIKVFISYSHKDVNLRKELEVHLSVLKRQGYITVWHDGEIMASEKWDEKTRSELEKADIVLILISPDYLASEYINDVEIKKALKLHQKGRIDVVPIILRECAWKEEKTLAALQFFPENGEPIDSNHWYNRDEAFTNVALGLKKVIKDRNEIKELEKESQSEIIRKGTRKIQVPGGPLLPDVVNYIERPADTQLRRLLAYGSAPMFLIIGGIQCGKTSLINRFIKKAKEKKENKIIHVDFSKLLTTNKNPGIKDIFIYILEKAFEDLADKKSTDSTLKDECDESTVIEWATEKLRKFFEKHLKTNKRTFLIIDSIDLLFEPKKFGKKESLIQWLVKLRNQQDSSPFDQLTIIAVMTISSYSSAYISPLKIQAANIALQNFGKYEINTLLKKLMGEESKNEGNATDIFNLFGGHPHLSHLAAYELNSCANFSTIQQHAMNLFGGYGSYWRRIKRILKYLIQKRDDIQSIDVLFKALLSEKKKRTEIKIIDDFFEQLYILDLVEMNHQISSDFIKNAIKKELAQNEAV